MNNFSSQFDLFHTMASQLTGLEDFGDTDYHDHLKRFLSDIDKYGVFNELGVQFLHGQIVSMLVGRLLLFDGLSKHPDALDTPIEKPIFIAGMARTGTTVLQRYLVQDTQFQSLPMWLGLNPMPRPPRETWDSHPVFQQTKQAMEQSPLFTEETMSIHPVHPEDADECRWIYDQSFWSVSLGGGVFKCPNYTAWLFDCDASFAFEYHKKALQLIANGDNRRWVLKDPNYMWSMESLLKVYPDACIIQTHREPIESIRSVANLGWQIRKMTQPEVTEEEHGAQQPQMWANGLNKMEAVRKNYPASQFFDLHMDEIKADAIGSMQRIYDYFDLSLSDDTLKTWQSQQAKDPNMGHDKPKPPVPSFGLSKEAVNELVEGYYQRYQAIAENAKC